MPVLDVSVRNPDGQAAVARGAFATIPPLPPSGGAHAYFDALVARPEHWRSYSLRDPRQLGRPNQGGYANSNTKPLTVTYDPEADAAKVVIPDGVNSLPNQIRVPLRTGLEPFVLTWDVYWTDSFKFANHGIGDYKTFQLSSGGRIWTEVKNRCSKGPFESVGLVDVRPYGPAEALGATIDGINHGSGHLGNLTQNWAALPTRWMRYWVRLAPRPGSTWWDFTLAVADEVRAPTLLYDRVGIAPNGAGGWDEFWLEFNTSTSEVRQGRGSLVALCRNVVLLRDVPLSSLLEQP